MCSVNGWKLESSLINTGIQNLRLSASRIFIPLLWAHIAVVGLIDFISPNESPVGEVLPYVLALAFAGIPTASYMLDRAGPITRNLVSIGFVGMASLFVAEGHGRWQVDFHMYYFAVFAILAAYCDWRAILVAAAATAIHHISLNFLYSAAVFPDGSDLPRVLLHASVVVIEGVVLVWLVRKLVDLFADSDRAVEVAKKMQEQESRLAAEKLDLQEMAAAEQHADRGRIAGLFEASIRTVVDTLGDSVGRLEGAAGKMTVLMDRTEDNTRAAAGAADEAAGSVRTVAAATEELSASIGEINRQVVQSSQIAQHAVAQARQANETVESLANAGIKIGEVVSLINEIAGQTNLLALNATIEAARAGEAGKGFAVVANEVKSLANQTARATEDISRQVEAIQGATGGAVTAIREVTATIEDIEQISGTIASAVDQQRSSTEEIARNVQNVSTGTEDVTRNISGVRQMNGDANAATGEVSEIASRLGLQSSKLAEEVDRFLQQIRNA